MIELENFLHAEICDYLIDYYENNKNKSTTYNWRKLIKINQNTEDLIIEKIIKPRYAKIFANDFLSNIELVKWPIGEYHDWHDDTAHYDQTTITYLNDGYEGGRTQIEEHIIEPKKGKIVIFDSEKRHRVSELKTNVRYVLAAWYNKSDK